MRIVRLKNATTFYEIGLLLFAVSIILFSACVVQQYTHLRMHSPLENISMQATSYDNKVAFTGMFDRHIRCNAQNLELHFINSATNEIVVLGQNKLTIAPTYNVPPGIGNVINIEYLLPTNITQGLWHPHFKATFLCANGVFRDIKYQELKSNLVHINP